MYAKKMENLIYQDIVRKVDFVDRRWEPNRKPSRDGEATTKDSDTAGNSAN
jgi:hypothetical protein